MDRIFKIVLMWVAQNAILRYPNRENLVISERSDYDDRKQEVFAGVVVEDGDLGATVYMLKIDDIEALRKVVNDTWDNPLYEDLTEEQRIKAIHEAQEIIFDQSNGKIEKSFLEQFSSAGISLYKADATMSKFDKLTLNNEEVKPNPCN